MKLAAITYSVLKTLFCHFKQNMSCLLCFRPKGSERNYHNYQYWVCTASNCQNAPQKSSPSSICTLFYYKQAQLINLIQLHFHTKHLKSLWFYYYRNSFLFKRTLYNFSSWALNCKNNTNFVLYSHLMVQKRACISSSLEMSPEHPNPFWIHHFIQIILHMGLIQSNSSQHSSFNPATFYKTG